MTGKGPSRIPWRLEGAAAPWLLLALAALALPFATGARLVPMAGWLAPLFLLGFARTASPRALPLGVLVAMAAQMLAWRGVLPFQGWPYYAATGAVGLVFFLPYVVDRLASARVSGWRRTLVFPCAYVVVEFAVSRVGFGTWGLLAYSQHGDGPLLQLLAVTGMAGVTFLICWAASLAVQLCSERPLSTGLRRAAGLYAALLATLLFAGGFRLARPDAGPTVRVAGIVVDNLEVFRGTWRPLSYGRPLTAEQATAAAPGARSLQSKLLERTRTAARQGARIVVWSEANGLAFKADEARLVDQARRLAAEERIYLFMALAVMTPGEPKAENKLIVIDPAGAVRGAYLKSHPTPGEMSIPGDRRVGVLQTPYGRLAWAICYDFDYPELIRQAGRAGADILIDPSWEHRGMDPLHSQMASFRAIENGAALFRPVNGGLSLAVDGMGRVLAATRAGTFAADLPTSGPSALHPWLGDAVPGGALVFLGWIGLRTRRAAPSVAAPEPTGRTRAQAVSPIGRKGDG